MKRENKFTQGPWETGYGAGIHGDRASWTVYWDEIEDINEIPIKREGSHEMVAVIPYSRDKHVAIADANLIAAAPELLEALEAIMATKHFTVIAELVDIHNAEEAIKKAYGE